MFTEYSDHSSDILFVEQWAAANGYKGVYSNELPKWRRDTMSNLVNAFDFNNVSLFPKFKKRKLWTYKTLTHL